MAAVFFVPEDAKICLTVFEALRTLPTLNALFEHAARTASPLDGPFKVTVAQCGIAFARCYELVKGAWSEMCAIVDVMELV